MTDWRTLDAPALRAERDRLRARYDAFRARNLTLDMTRGKPSPEQLRLSLPMLEGAEQHYVSPTGIDCRNYGGLEGLPEARRLFGEYLGAPAEQVIVGGASSLAMMYDVCVRAVLFGVPGGEGPWGRRETKFLCPSPGYDRHFAICEQLGIGMIPVEMHDDGPDMEVVERLVATDPTIVGMWCVPKFSNPTGAVYSDEVVGRLAAMPSAAGDFRIFWDNSYAVHAFQGEPAPLRNLLTACTEAGHPDRALMYASTAKITFAGAGVAAMAASPANVAWNLRVMGIQTIGPDKLNQLRHVLFLRDMPTILAHMRRHAELLRPKFEAVQRVLGRELAGKGIAEWTDPRGGYFVSLNTLDGCATDVIRMAAEAGVSLTPAGSTFPYKRDPRDRNIRIAPSFPRLEEIEAAMELLGICVQMVSSDRLLGR
ncbi:MAG: aminotransferase class I/II-fold pyridoxal phosphate-dependent enzyme [Chloroflexi bacterium]|nr:aminotransferase class I/II-fold pyridoxal phosphate-dependent enzyme [Chloroflexota bacterium]